MKDILQNPNVRIVMLNVVIELLGMTQALLIRYRDKEMLKLRQSNTEQAICA